MVLMGLAGYGGLGAVDWSTCARTATSTDGTQLECIDSNDNVIATQVIAGAASGTTPTTDQGSWWSTALTALVKGTAQGLTTPSTALLPSCAVVPVGTPCIPVVPVPAWYETPTGMVGIAIAVLGVGYLFLKK